MSKINARSPFYLSYSTPVAPTPEFTCTIANATDFEVDQEGVISRPKLSFGTIKSFTSSDSGFSNGKYATVSTPTTRTVVFKINIPSGFSNTSAATIDCPLTASQPAKVTSGTTPSCAGGPTLNGSIPNQTIVSGGNTVTIDLSTKFTQGTSAIAGFTAINYTSSFVQMSITGSTLTLTSLNTGGVNKVYVRAFDNDANTCTAVQGIQVTVTVSAAFDCTAAGLKGGGIAQDGTITDPNLIGIISKRMLTSGGSAISGPPYNAGANSTSSAVSKELFFDITAPSGYSNAGSTITNCPRTFSQAGTTAPTFTCDDAGFSDQAIYDTGTINIGKAEKGTITGVTPVRFQSVQSDTPRTINLSITIPTGFANAGSAKSGGCDIVGILQPAQIPVFGNVNYFLALDFVGNDPADFCQSGFNLSRTTPVKSTATSIEDAQNNTVASTDSSGNATRLFNGRGFYYVVDTFSNRSSLTSNSAVFYIWRISENGVITEVYRWDCEGGGNGNGNEI